MIVDVAHPAPVSFVPPRARRERFVHAAMRSPVELVEDDLARSVEVGPLFPKQVGVMAEPMRLLDGRLWCPVAAHGKSGPFREAALDEFVAWLSGRETGGLTRFFQRQFAGTPLVALDTDARADAIVMAPGVETRGEDLDLSLSRKILSDGRDRARAEVARYVAEEIRVLGGRPYMRSAPVLKVEGSNGPWSYEIRSRAWKDDPDMRTLPALPGTFEAVVRILRGLGGRPSENTRYESERQRWASLVPAGAIEGDDVRFVLNHFAEPVRKSLDNAIVGAGARPHSRERLEAARQDMRGIVIAAMTGTAHHDGTAAVLTMREALAAWKADPGAGSHGQEFLLAFLDKVVIPRIDAQAVADLDEVGLLAP